MRSRSLGGNRSPGELAATCAATGECTQPVSDTFPLVRIISVNNNYTPGGTASINIVKYSNLSAGGTKNLTALVKVYDEKTSLQHRRIGELEVLRYLAKQKHADRHCGLMDQNWQALQKAGFFQYGLPVNSLYFQFEEGTSDLYNLLGCFCMPQMIEVATQLRDALNFLQSNCIWHRDIKVENVILVNKVGSQSYKIIDFGFSKIVASEELSNRCAISNRHGGICGSRDTFSANVLMQHDRLSMPEGFIGHMRQRSILEEDEWSLCMTLWGLADSDAFGLTYCYSDYCESVRPNNKSIGYNNSPSFFISCYNQVISLLNGIVSSIESYEKLPERYQTTKGWLKSLAIQWQLELNYLKQCITTPQSHSDGSADDSDDSEGSGVAGDSSSDTIRQSSESPKPPIATQPSHSDGSADDSDDSNDSVVSVVAGGSSCCCLSLFCESSNGSASSESRDGSLSEPLLHSSVSG